MPRPKLWQNLLATELVEVFPSHVVAAWLGHSEIIADKHYRQVTDEHFQRAMEVAAGVAAASGNALQPAANCNLEGADSLGKAKNPGKSGVSSGRYRARTKRDLRGLSGTRRDEVAAGVAKSGDSEPDDQRLGRALERIQEQVEIMSRL